jgi:UDP-glucose 4-epimerase
MGGFYRVLADKRDLNYEKYFTQGDSKEENWCEFNSNNTDRLSVSEMKEKLLSLNYIKDELNKLEIIK